MYVPRPKKTRLKINVGRKKKPRMQTAEKPLPPSLSRARVFAKTKRSSPQSTRSVLPSSSCAGTAA